MLSSSGFTELSEIKKWTLKAAGKYFLSRNNSSIIAFTVGGKFSPETTGFKIIGTHTDSPNLRLNPNSKMKAQNCQQTCVSTYGGGKWETWFDRDLKIAGRVMIQKKDGNGKVKYDQCLFDSVRPLCKVSSLCIHLQSGAERKSFSPNKETHIRPILSSEIYTQLAGIKENPDVKGPLSGRHHWGLLEFISKTIKIPVEDILELDLSFADTQPAQLYGLHEEFLSSPRIDNLFSTFFAMKALAESDPSEKSFIDLVAAYDHEEIGSVSQQGANSKFTLGVCQRVFEQMVGEKEGTKEVFDIAIKKSFIISADMAHAIHPNYASKHQTQHAPHMNNGIVVKTNFNQRYMTDGVSGSILRLIAKKAGIPIQEFVVRNDSPCGSTIGSYMASQVNAKTVDIGGTQLSMHSIRETCGIIDAQHYRDLFGEFFKSYETIDHTWFDN